MSFPITSNIPSLTIDTGTSINQKKEKNSAETINGLDVENSELKTIVAIQEIKLEDERKINAKTKQEFNTFVNESTALRKACESKVAISENTVVKAIITVVISVIISIASVFFGFFGFLFGKK